MGHFSSWHEFANMGGYALYVWPAYAAVIAVLVFSGCRNVYRLQRALRRVRRDLQSKSRRHVNKT